KIHSFCTAKEKINKTKKQPREWEKIPANDILDKGLVSKIYKELIRVPGIYQTQHPKTNNSVKKRAKDMNRHFSKEDIQMANRHVKRCSTSPIIRAIQIKTTVRHYLMPVRKVKINNSGNNGYWQGCWQVCGEMGTLLHCWWECKLVQPLWKTVGRFLKKLTIELHYDPAVALLAIYPRDTGVLMHRGTWTPMFIAALSAIAKTWKEPKCPSTDEWIKKMWFIYTVEYYMAMRKNDIWPCVATWMELEGVMLSE
ncbi:LORF2 protein, partial [Crocuta crocuta]